MGITGSKNNPNDTVQERPRQPMQELHTCLTKILQTILASLKNRDMDRMVLQGKRAYWIKESPQEIAAWIRQNLSALSGCSMKVRICIPTSRISYYWKELALQ